MFSNKAIRYSLILFLFILLGVFIANRKIKTSYLEFISSDVSTLPSCKTAVLLGTGKYLKGGTLNLFFRYRIVAANELFLSGKIRYIIISGDNSVKGYNEPQDMKDELVKLGIPDSVIFLDYAGFRTFDSMIRAKEIFGQTKFIVVSQKFHNQRAVYIARENNIEAFGYNAKDVPNNVGFKTRIREVFARVKVFIDLYTGKEPRFLGQKVVIP